jgi:hypothetical protein
MKTIYAIQNKKDNTFVNVNGKMFFTTRDNARTARATLVGNDYRIVVAEIYDWKTAK